MTDAAIRCTTHHAACDCREAATRAALDAALAERDRAVGALSMLSAGYRVALDTARRAALEEAIAVCRARDRGPSSDAHDDGAMLERVHIVTALRALIDTPRTDPVRPAPVGASEGT